MPQFNFINTYKVLASRIFAALSTTCNVFLKNEKFDQIAGQSAKFSEFCKVITDFFWILVLVQNSPHEFDLKLLNSIWSINFSLNWLFVIKINYSSSKSADTDRRPKRVAFCLFSAYLSLPMCYLRLNFIILTKIQCFLLKNDRFDKK